MEFTSAADMTGGARGAQPTRSPLELSARSRELLAILADSKGDANVLYEGALRVSADGANPARIRLAAHALRELLDALEREAGFTRQRGLKERVGDLHRAWKVAQRSFEVDSGRGTGFAQTLDEFFVAFETDYPARRDQASATIGRLDPARRQAPPAVRDARAETWMRFRDYFTKVLHGGIRPTDGEFRTQLESFEVFLLDWFQPRTFDDFDAIDELLRKGPPDA